MGDQFFTFLPSLALKKFKKHKSKDQLCAVVFLNSSKQLQQNLHLFFKFLHYIRQISRANCRTVKQMGSSFFIFRMLYYYLGSIMKNHYQQYFCRIF